MSHIFISYNQDDADFAAVLMTELEKAGFDTWLDKERLRPGADWSDEIDHGLRTASAVVLVVSPSSRASEYVTYEWGYAIGAGIRVVPVLRRDTEIHPRLRRLQYLDFRATDVRPWNKLIQELQSIKAESQSHWKPPRDAPSYIHRAVIDLDSGNIDDRHGAIDAIARWEHKEARLALQHALASPFRDVRAWAAIALAENDDPAATTEIGLRALTDALLRDFDGRPDSDAAERERLVATKANSALLKIGRGALDHLAQVAKSKTNRGRTYATSLLSRVGGKEAVPTLLELVNETDGRVAESAIRQLGMLMAVEAVPAILRRMIESATGSYDNADSVDEREDMAAAVRALVQIGDKSIESHLVAATKHPTPTVRMCAAQLLGQLGGATAIPILADLLADTDTARHVTSEDGGLTRYRNLSVGDVAAEALEQIKTPEARELAARYRREQGD